MIGNSITYVSNDGFVSGWYQYWGIYPPICGCVGCGACDCGVICGGLWSPERLPGPSSPLFGPFDQWGGGGFCSQGILPCDGGLNPVTTKKFHETHMLIITHANKL